MSAIPVPLEMWKGTSQATRAARHHSSQLVLPAISKRCREPDLSSAAQERMLEQ